MNNFYYALSLLNTTYGILMNEDEFEEIAYLGWNLIGNKRTRLYRYVGEVCNGQLELPCNLSEIEAVTIPMEEWDFSTNDTPNGDLSSAFTEHYIEHRKSFKSPLYIPGKYVNYERVGDTLYFNDVVGKVMVLYKGEILDENGFPEITDKEAMAIATYCAYIYKFREGIQTNNGNIILLSNLLKSKWDLLVDLARVDQYLSQNEWDEVLDAKTNWGRKLHNKSLKPYR